MEVTAGDKDIFILQDADGWHRLDVRVCRDDCDTTTAMANARLIAAAPEYHHAARPVGKSSFPQFLRLCAGILRDNGALGSADVFEERADDFEAAIEKATDGRD